MSHYVYLDACPFPRMPDGRAGEWRVFWADQRPELEAKNAPPLLWWCLFGADSLRRARLADEADADDPERSDIPTDDDTSYAYLVADQDTALRRLASRRPAVLEAIGERHAPLYDGFAALIRQDFGPYILLRTSDLPDPEGIEPWLSRMAGEMDALDAGRPAAGSLLAGVIAEARQAEGVDLLWRLSGGGQPGIWPTPALAMAYPARPPGQAPAAPARQRLDGILEWGAALATAGVALATYGLTASLVLGGLAFLASGAVTVWLLLRLG